MEKNLSYYVEITIEGEVPANQYDLGAVTLTCEDRSYILDVVSSNSYRENGKTFIDAKAVEDKETFDEMASKYDLKIEDLFSPKLKGIIYIGSEYEVEPLKMVLKVTLPSGDVFPIVLENECEY